MTKKDILKEGLHELHCNCESKPLLGKAFLELGSIVEIKCRKCKQVIRFAQEKQKKI